MTESRLPKKLAPLLAVGTLIIFVVLAEIILLLVSPVEDPRNQVTRQHPYINQYVRMSFPPGLDLETSSDEGLPGLTGTRRFSTNGLGFRGPELATPKPANERRVFLVGGSTTECFYLDDEEAPDAILQRTLNIADGSFRVNAAGNSGAASDDHIAMISQRIVHLEPDVVVVFCGINDLTRAIFDFDYLHYTREMTQPLRPWYERLILKSQIACRLYLLTSAPRSAQAIQEATSLKTDYAGKIGLQRSVAVSDGPPVVNLASYATNLRTIAGLCKANDIELVFVTQQTTWNSRVDQEIRNFHWMRLRNGVTYSEPAMDAAMEEYNDVMREVAAEFDIPLYDLAREIPKSSAYFYDDCHFNAGGAEFLGNALAPIIHSLPFEE